MQTCPSMLGQDPLKARQGCYDSLPLRDFYLQSNFMVFLYIHFVLILFPGDNSFFLFLKKNILSYTSRSGKKSIQFVACLPSRMQTFCCLSFSHSSTQFEGAQKFLF